MDFCKLNAHVADEVALSESVTRIQGKVEHHSFEFLIRDSFGLEKILENWVLAVELCRRVAQVLDTLLVVDREYPYLDEHTRLQAEMPWQVDDTYDLDF